MLYPLTDASPSPLRRISLSFLLFAAVCARVKNVVCVCVRAASCRFLFCSAQLQHVRVVPVLPGVFRILRGSHDVSEPTLIIVVCTEY